MRYVRTLTESQRHTLENRMKHDPSPRAQARAHSILLSSRRVTIKEIVRIYQVDRDTIASWIKKWEHDGDCSRATGFIQHVQDGVMQGFVDGLQFGLHATDPAQDVS